jgi:hypothetical protein
LICVDYFIPQWFAQGALTAQNQASNLGAMWITECPPGEVLQQIERTGGPCHQRGFLSCGMMTTTTMMMMSTINYSTVMIVLSF